MIDAESINSTSRSPGPEQMLRDEVATLEQEAAGWLSEQRPNR